MTRFLKLLVKPRRAGLLLGTLVVSLALAASTMVLMRTDQGAALEQRTVDARFDERGTLQAPKDIVVLAIDDTNDSYSGRWPIDRYTLGRAIRELDEAGVAAVAIDMPQDWRALSDGEDRTFVDAIAESEVPVVLARSARPDGAAGPLDGFDQASRAALEGKFDSGVSARVRSVDGSVRSYPVQGDEAGLAAALATAAGAGDSVTAAPDELLLNWYGPRGSFDQISFHAVATGTAIGADLAGKIVLIGPTEGVGRDDHDVPVGSRMSSVEIQATALANVLDGSWLREPAAWVEPAAVLTMAIAVWALLLVVPLGLSVPASIALVLGWGWLAERLFEQGLVVPMLTPMLAGAVVFGTLSVTLAALAVRERVRVKALFARYVHADVVRELIDGEDRIDLGGEEREITVLFSDIRGFTSMSEQVDPAEMVSQLNEYFEAMVEVVARHHGAVDKFLGDGLMAIFGAPVPYADHARRACMAATEMLERLDEVNDDRAERGLAPLRIGIGVHTGRAVVGNVGSPPFRVDFTAIGDTVNLAARIEAMTKELGAAIVASEATRDAIGGEEAELSFEPLGSIVARGRTAQTAVLAVTRSDGREQHEPGEQAA
jgi:adenylate cyclase